MNRIKNSNEENGFSYMSNYSIRLKFIVSISFGFISLLLSPFGIHSMISEVNIDIPWSLLLPILASIAFGWRYGFISAISGAAFFPFLLWPDNGIANLLTSILFLIFFTSIGIFNKPNDDKEKRFEFLRYFTIVLIFIALLTLSFLLLFNKLLYLNSFLWPKNTIKTIDQGIIYLFIIKDSINILVLTLIADLLLRLPTIRRLFGIGVLKSMRFNTKITYYSLFISFLIWLSYLGLSIVLLKHNGFFDGHIILAFFIILVGCLFAARVVIHFVEKQIEAFNKQQESEVYLKLQIEKMPIGYVVWDKELRVKSWNPTAEKIFGFSSDFTVRKTAYETIVPKHIQENVSKIWHDLKFKGIESRNISENITKSGEIIICEWTNTPIKDNDGNIIEIISMVQDITIRKKVEECLQFIALHEWDDAGNNFFHSITKYMGKTLNLDYVLICNVINNGKTAETISYYVNGKIIQNRKYELFNTPCQNVYGKEMCFYPNNIQKLFPEDSALAKMNAEGYIGHPLWDSNGNPIGLIACISKKELKSTELIKSIINIISTRVSSEMVRKQSKDLLESSEAKYRLLFENMTSGFALHEMIYDDNGKPIDYRYLAANPSYERLTGISASTIVGKRVKELLPNLEQYWVDSFSSVAQTGKPITYQNYSRDINKYFDTWVFSPKENQFAVVFNDITERVLAEKSLKESEANLNSLINNRNDAIWSIDTNYNFITLNAYFKDEYKKYFNIELKKGMNAMEFIVPDLAPLWKEKYDLALAGQKVAFDFSIKAVVDTQFYEVSLNPIISDNIVTGVSALSVNITDRKKNEFAIIESEKLFSSIFQYSPIALVITVPFEGTIIDVNDAFLKQIEYSREEVIGKTAIELGIYNDSNDRIRIQEIIKEKSFVSDFECSFRTKSGKIVYGLLSMVFIQIKGKFYQLTTALNITERKHAENKLLESEKSYSGLFNSVTEAIYIQDENGYFLDINVGAEKMYGYSRDEIIGKTPEFLGADGLNDLPKVKGLIGKAFITGESQLFEFWGKRKNGEIFPKDVVANKGKFFGRDVLITTARDVSERKLSEEKLKKTLSLLRATLESTADGIIVTDLNGKIVNSNNKFFEIWDLPIAISTTYKVDTLISFMLDQVKYPEEFQIKLDEIYNSQDETSFDVIALKGGRSIEQYSIPQILDGKSVGRVWSFRDITERLQSEEALRESEFFFKESQRAANVGSYKTDFIKGTWESSEVLDNIFGIDTLYTRSIQGWLDIVHPDDKVMMQNYLADEVILKQNTFNKEYRINRKSDGETRWVLGLGFPLFSENGEITTLTGTIQDITERKLAEELLSRTQANISAIIENTSDSIWAINTNYEILYINNVFKQAYLESFGILLEVGMNLIDNIPEKFRPQWKARYDRAFKNENFIIEDRIDLGYTSIFIELAVNPIVIDGKVEGASLFSRDITERKKAEEALRISEERFKVVSESAEEWIWEVDKNGIYTYSNSIVEKILGYTPEEIVGKKHFFDFFEPSNKKMLKESVFNTFENILAFKDFENVNIHKNGNKVIFKTSGSPIFNSEGELIGYRGADIDITIQKRIEMALLESEEKYRLTFMTSPDSVNINTLDGIYVDINDGFTQLTGYTREDVIGISSLDINIWYFAEDRKRLTKKLLKDGYVSNLESVFRCKDGTLKTALMSARIIKINNTPHILSITRDISERKLLEDNLVESEKKYRKLFEKSNDAIFIIDKKTGNYLDANKAAVKITGYNLDELKKLSTIDITPIDAKKRLSKITNINKSIEFGEIEYFRPDGTTRFALASVIPINEDKVYGIAHDITERKQFEDALSILSSAVDQSPISVVITDTNGSIEYVNPKFTEITGYNLEEVIGKNPNVLKSGYTSNEEYKNLWKTISSGQEWRGVFQNKKKNGEKFWESALISPITNESGKTTHYLAVKEDITEKKEAERRILSSIIDTEEKERNRFSKELHDGLGPLLSTIKLYFQWISEANEPEKRKLIIEKGEKNINEAIETIREISNNLSPRTLSTFGAIVAIRNFIDNVNHTQKILINLRSNTENRFEKNIETVLYRVTSELINNTLKYAKASKVDVNIFYEQPKSIIMLTYIDNGVGFNLEKVLSSGKGLGLMNIEQRVNSLDGKFKIDSKEGHGVFVEIVLPANFIQIIN